MDFVIDPWLRKEEDGKYGSQELLRMPIVHSKPIKGGVLLS